MNDLSNGSLNLWLLPLFALFFVGLWLSFGFLVGRFSGWAELAKRYGQESANSGPSVLTSGTVGSLKYINVLRLAADDWGVHLSVLLLFRIGHRPLSIPWSQVQVTSAHRFVTEYVRLSIDQVTIDVRKNDVRHLGRRHGLPGPLRHLEE